MNRRSNRGCACAGRSGPRVIASALSLALVARTTAAPALDAEVTSDTAAQFYDLRSPTGETVLSRRRLTATLGVSAYDLIGGGPERAPHYDPARPELAFRARLRYDADFGQGGAETDVTNAGRLVPGLEQAPVDLMYGYLEGRKFLHGWLGFKLGRQYVVDALGFYAFDGGEVRLLVPLGFALEGYGGLEVRGGMPLSTPRFERDGVWRGDRSAYDPSLYPAFSRSDVAPVVAVAAETTGLTWMHARATYRRVVNTGSSVVRDGTLRGTAAPQPVTYEGTRVSQERLGASVSADAGRLFGARAETDYDLYLAKLASLVLSADLFLGDRLTLSVDYDYVRPTFDADSVWNFFASEPMNDVGVRAVLLASGRLSVSGGAHARVYTVNGLGGDAAGPLTGLVDFTPIATHPFDAGFDLAARYRWREGWLGLRGSGSWGDGSDRVGADASVERVLERRYVLEGRLSLWQWKDSLRPDRSTTSFAYVAGAGYRFAPRSEGRFELEHDMNGLVGQRLRAMLWLRVAVVP